MAHEIKTIDDSEPINATLRSMQNGDRCAFSAKRYGSVRAAVSQFNFVLGKSHYTAKADRENHRVLVTRIS